MSKTELFAWRNKGYADVMAGKPVSPASLQATREQRRVYLEGRRAAIKELEAKAE